MAVDIKLWEIDGQEQLKEIRPAKLDLENRLETWLERDISTISQNLLVIGRQVSTEHGGYIDLLGIEPNGDLVIVELKRDKTPREITAQALDYASWVKDLSNEKITEIANAYLDGFGSDLEAGFQREFNSELPDVLNEHHKILIVASHIDSSSERIIRYLSDTYGVNINAVTFHYFRAEGKEYLGRAFLLEPSQVDYKTRTKASSTSKRQPNLSLEELEEVAVQRGVGELYGQLLSGLKECFNRIKPTRSSLACKGEVGDSKKATIFSVIPGESSQEDGLRFQVYLGRFAAYLGTGEDEATKLLPQHKETWKFSQGVSAEYSGYAGFFKNQADIGQFVDGIKSCRKTIVQPQQNDSQTPT